MSRLIFVMLFSAVAFSQVVVHPGDDLQALVSRNPPGTTFSLQPGIYRLQSVQPRSQDSFVGQRGAILSGAQLLTSFVREGAHWVHPVHVEPVESKGVCGPTAPDCNLPEDLFMDGALLRRESNLGAVGPGSWYLDSNGSKVVMGDDPKGRTVELSLARTAFYGDASDVTIRGLVIEKYATPTRTGAIHGGLLGAPKRGSGWVVEDNEIRFNHSVGIWVGNRMHMLRNHIHHNGRLGAGGSGRDLVLDGNEIAYNNYAGYSYHWEAGGAKFVLSDGLEARNNFVHHNEGPGLWSDIDNDRALYENNHTASNKVAGIFFEISFGAVIRNNTIENEGANAGPGPAGAGILVNNSSHAEVYGNRIVNCINGILGLSYDRGMSKWTNRQYLLRDLNVHDNTIVEPREIAAGLNAKASAPDDWKIRFEANTYFLAHPEGRHFRWMTQDCTAEQWKSFQQDGHGRFLPASSAGRP